MFLLTACRRSQPLVVPVTVAALKQQSAARAVRSRDCALGRCSCPLGCLVNKPDGAGARPVQPGARPDLYTRRPPRDRGMGEGQESRGGGVYQTPVETGRSGGAEERVRVGVTSDP